MNDPLDHNAIEKGLSTKSDQELIAMLENPSDWMPFVLNLVRSELGRRSISPAQVDERIAIKAKQIAEDFQKRSTLPLTSWETIWTVLYGVIGLIGLFFVNSQASSFKTDGYLLKHRKSWRVFWLVFGLKTLLVAIIILIAIA